MEVNGSREANNNEEIDEEEDLDLDAKSVEKFLEIFTLHQLRALVKLAVWKDPVVAENFRHLVDVESGHRQVSLNNLTEDHTAEILISFFGKYGEIEKCICFGRGSGGFIIFKHGSDARKALKQPLKKIGNITIECIKGLKPFYDLRSSIPEMEPRMAEFTKRMEFAPIIDKYMEESAMNALEEPHKIFKIFEGHTLYCQKAVDGPKGNMGHHHQQQQHDHHNQPHYHSKEKKSKYSHGDGPSHCGDGHLMAPTSPVVGGYNRGVPQQGYNPAPVNLAGPIPTAYDNQVAMNYRNQPWMQWGYQSQNEQQQQQEQDETLKDQQQYKEAEEENAAEASNDAAMVEVNGSGEGYNNEEELDEEEDLDLDDVEKLLETFDMKQLRPLVKQAFEKDPVFAEIVCQLADMDCALRRIFVHVHGSLGWDATAETLTSVFGKYGEIEDCKHYTDKHSGPFEGCTFILFKHRSSVRKALKQPLKKIGNRAVVCESTSSIGPIVTHLYQYRNAKNNKIGLEGCSKNFEELHKNVVVKLSGPIPVAYGNQTAMIYEIQPGVEKGYHNTPMGHGGHYWNPTGMQHGYQNPHM